MRTRHLQHQLCNQDPTLNTRTRTSHREAQTGRAGELSSNSALAASYLIIVFKLGSISVKWGDDDSGSGS